MKSKFYVIFSNLTNLGMIDHEFKLPAAYSTYRKKLGAEASKCCSLRTVILGLTWSLTVIICYLGINAEHSGLSSDLRKNEKKRSSYLLICSQLLGPRKIISVIDSAIDSKNRFALCNTAMELAYGCHSPGRYKTWYLPWRCTQAIWKC